MINLALIGVGKWGKNYLNTAKTSTKYKIKYICSRKKRSLEALGSNYIKIQDYKKLLEYKDLNGIIIATPPTSHFEIASFFVKKNKNILIEKPFVTSYSQALKINKMTKKSRSKIMIGYLQLYNPAYQKIKELIGKNSIKGIFFDVEKSPKRKDVSVLWDWAPHFISITIDLLDLKPLKVSARKSSKSKVYSKASASLFFKNIKVDMEMSWLGKKTKRLTVIQTDNEKFELDDKMENRITVIKNHNIAFPKYEKTPPLQKELEYFCNLITKNNSSKDNVKKAVLITKIIDLLDQSAKMKGKVLNFTGS